MNRSMLESLLRRVVPESAADADLLRRFAADRDEAAFAALVRRHGPLVWAACRGLLAVEADAEDAFQATFLALARSPGSIRNPAALAGWLHGAACRVALKVRREAGRRRNRERAAALVEAGEPVAEATWDRLRAALHEEVCKLPESLRTAFVLCELEGVAQSEAAASLGWKPGTLTGRLSKARRQLLERLAKRGVPAGAVLVAAAGGGAAATAAPFALAAKATALARAGSDLTGVITTNILELARGATEVSMTRTRLMAAAAALVAALAIGTATTVIPVATAQRPAPPLPAPDEPVPPPADRLEQMRLTATVPGQWEYKFFPRPSDSLEGFERLLRQQGAEGWEYAGIQSLTPTDPKKKEFWGTNPTVIFKRQRSQGITTQVSDPLAPRKQGPAAAYPPSPDVVYPPVPPSATYPPVAPRAVDPPAPALGPPLFQGGRAPDVHVIRLAHSRAPSLAKTLEELFSGRYSKLVADERTNSLLVLADEATLKAIQALILKLDVPGTQNSGM